MASFGQTEPINANSHSARKMRRNGERRKVTRACDRCKKRKIKCDGNQPCEFCSQAMANCTFNAAYARGRLPVVPENVSATSKSMSTADVMMANNGVAIPAQRSAMSSMEATTDTTRPQREILSPGQIVPPASAYADSSLLNSPEPSQTDMQGHYNGPSSGVSFLLRIQKRLERAISFSQPSSIFMFGDAPLQVSEFDPSFCMMLPRDDAQRLVDRYFDFAMPTYRFLHRPTIQTWFDEFYNTLGTMHDAHTAPAKIALLFMVLAHGRVYMPDGAKIGPSDLSARYYQAAEHQLANEKGSIRLPSIQARLTQCCYILTQSRVNHCWNLFGTVARLALAIGLNRNSHGANQVETESRRRTFWCAYALDAYLSAALGRSRAFRDEDIDTEFPACIDDEDITMEPSRTSVSTPTQGQSIMLAAIANIKLARIVSKILSDLYAIKPISMNRRAVLTERISKDLSDWRVGLVRFLDADYFTSSFLIPIFQRQRNVLNLTYWHALILTHRPFLLNSFGKHSQQNKSAEEEVQTQESVQQCLVAAMSTVSSIDEMTEKRQMYRAFWIASYFAFTANLVLYLYVIQKRASSPEIYRDYLSAAIRCQSHIAKIAEKGSLPERYCLVLEELRLEAIRQTERMRPSTTSVGRITGGLQGNEPQSTSIATNMNFGGPADFAHLLNDASLDFEDVPGSVSSDYAGWDQFASMVSSGLGNLDGFLNDDSFTF